VKARAIVNPQAGVAARRSLEALRNPPPALRGVELRLTEAPGHALSLAREAVAAGCELVLVAGGDGTVNEAAHALVGSAQATLALVPVGSGNGLARALGIPLRPEAALEALATGIPRSMDVGLINGRLFLNVAGAGLDAAIGEAFQARGREGGRRGILSYVTLSLRHAFRYPSRHWQLEADGLSQPLQARVVTFANGPQYGAGAVIAPGARLDDGRFDVVAFDPRSVAELVVTGARLFLGGLERSRAYRRITTRSAVLSGPAVPHHRDGEPEAAAERYEVRLEPRALRVLVPRATAQDPGGPFSA